MNQFLSYYSYTAGVCAFYYYFLLHDRRECVTALFAGVIVFFSAFIELVAVSVVAVGMAGSRWR